jgi:sec-independent protein translocase protein TatB
MFGGSFSELALIFLVALVVLGPTRMPGLVRTVGRWVGKARAMARDFQQQLENEVNLDELNRLTDMQANAARSTPGSEESASSTSAPTTATTSPEDSGYPYGPPPPESGPLAADSPASSDDTYSHAHAAGEAPVLDEPANPGADRKKDDNTA